MHMHVEDRERLERETGFEPATSSLGSWHSTPELLPLRYENVGRAKDWCQAI
jgi:hypothetical protein